MTKFLQIFLDASLYLLLIPLLFGSALSLVSHRNKSLVVIYFGFFAQVIGGGIGIIIHELSHLIVALLFRHQIKGVALLRIPRPNDGDTSLGYVQHAWQTTSLYQRSGNFFIGVAPLIGGTVALVALTRWLVPPIFAWWQSLATGVSTTATGDLVWWKVLIWVVLLSNISVGGFDLSTADLENSSHGLFILVAFYLLVLIIASLFFTPTQIKGALLSFMIPVYWALGLALLINLITLTVLKLLGRAHV